MSRCKGNRKKSRPERFDIPTPPMPADDLVGLAYEPANEHRGMNQYEKDYFDEILKPGLISGKYAYTKYESITLRLADRTTYTPDWYVIRSDGVVEFHEVKGGLTREDAWVKLKVAADQYPHPFYKCHRGKRSEPWTITPIGARSKASMDDTKEPKCRA